MNNLFIAAREKCLSHDRDWMKKGMSKKKTLRYVFLSTWYGTKIWEKNALEVKKNINYRNRWHVINKTSLY